MNALKMVSMDPVTVTILSGHEPSDMLILAPLCNDTKYSASRHAKDRAAVKG